MSDTRDLIERYYDGRVVGAASGTPLTDADGGSQGPFPASTIDRSGVLHGRCRRQAAMHCEQAWPEPGSIAPVAHRPGVRLRPLERTA